MNLKIVCDSSSNLFTLDGTDFTCVPMKIITSVAEYVDTPQLDVMSMIADLKYTKGKSGTSCPNMQEWLDAFQGADRVFAVTITGNLSGSCNACMQAAQEYESLNPQAKVTVIDSLSAGPEVAMLLEKLALWAAEGRDFEDIFKRICTYQKRTHLAFSLESLTNLARNGRVNPAVARLAGVLGIRVVGEASAEGTLAPLHKVRGEQNALKTLYSDMKSRGYRGGYVRIAHCLNRTAADALKAMVRKEFPKAPVRIERCTGLCSFYAEEGGLLVGYEGA